MKSIFGFVAGAALAAGGLYGLRKVLRVLEPSDVGVSASPGVTVSRPVSTAAATLVPKAEAVKAPEPKPDSTPEIATARMVEDLEKAQEAVSELEERFSLVGEPAARHEEPIAAVESIPEATNPRSETAEEAVPENLEVVPASATPKKTSRTVASSTEKKPAKAPSKTSKVASAKPDDFTVIVDIGPVFNQKLHAAGILSFKELAGLTAAQVEEKTSIPAERVERGKWIEQSQKIAAGETEA